MPERELGETIARVAIYLPLAFIAWQVVQLSRLLVSRAWTRIAIGFGVVALLRGYVLFVTTVSPVYYLLSLLTAYAFIGWGFHTLKRDVVRVRAMPYDERTLAGSTDVVDH